MWRDKEPRGQTFGGLGCAVTRGEQDMTPLAWCSPLLSRVLLGK